PLCSPRADLARRELRAWDPIERHVLWSVHEALPISSGALVTAGGLVFYGTGDGWLKALDARTGRVLWKHRVDGGRKLDAPVSYRGADGHQYIAVRTLAPVVADTPHEGSATVLLFALAH
ncbi:MAG TPA: PQQ-binding-like beta-propeller repeat protein, partial [Steroidobacteraceae bacterium]